jgi:hypothetical protein
MEKPQVVLQWLGGQGQGSSSSDKDPSSPPPPSPLPPPPPPAPPSPPPPSPSWLFLPLWGRWGEFPLYGWDRVGYGQMGMEFKGMKALNVCSHPHHHHPDHLDLVGHQQLWCFLLLVVQWSLVYELNALIIDVGESSYR